MVCAHRENLPALLGAALAAAVAVSVSRPRGDYRRWQLPAGWDAPLPTAAFLALHLAGGALVAADRYDLSDA